MKKINWTYCGGFLALLFTALAFTSCEKYIDIDKYVYDKMTLDSMFTSQTRTLEYINGTAAYLKDESKQIGDWNVESKTSSPSGLGADEAIQPWVNDDHPGTKLVVDAITPQSTSGVNPWADFYKGIRKANLILERIGENTELTESEMNDYTGLAYFLRAYFYYSLVRLYGPVPILPNTAFESDASVESVSYERSTYDECIEYICADLEQAAKKLPRKRETVYQKMPTKGAALAVLARLRLHSASPLYNGNTFYASWTRTDGTPFIAQTVDPTRWGKAAAAFKRIIDMNQYQILTVSKVVNTRGTSTLELPDNTGDPNLKTQVFPNGAMDIDPYLSYKGVFDGSVVPESNPELIYFSTMTTEDQDFFYPDIQGGNTAFSVTKDMVEQYRMADGRQFSEATDEEKSWKAVGSGLTFSENYTLSSDRAKMDDNREPRYYASIGFNYCVWPASSYTGSTSGVKNLTATYYVDDNNTRGSGDEYNRTGYTSRKYVNQEDCYTYGNRNKTKYYPMIRYAEILLGYVEAMNEMNDSYTDEVNAITVSRNVQEMVYYFNQIRYRAGLPGITATEAGDYETMKSLLKQEWRVEFAFEDHRYYDLRRWKDAPEAYREPIIGMDITAKKAEREKFYTEKVWNTERATKRVWKDKMYFFPIAQSTLDKNGKLVQNPGW